MDVLKHRWLHTPPRHGVEGAFTLRGRCFVVRSLAGGKRWSPSGGSVVFLSLSWGSSFFSMYQFVVLFCSPFNTYDREFLMFNSILHFQGGSVFSSHKTLGSPWLYLGWSLHTSFWSGPSEATSSSRKKGYHSIPI